MPPLSAGRTMPRILLTASFPEDLILRQTPGRSGRWEDFDYVVEPQSQPIDGWVVYDDMQAPVVQQCPPHNTLLITGEPPSLRRYRKRFTSQFGQVWTSHTTIDHPRVTLRHECQHWHYALHPGRTHRRQLGYDELLALPRPNKQKLMSVICSAKADSPDHRQRLEFVRFLKSRLGDQLDVYGRGIRSVDDKSDAIYDYKYHIVLENDHSQYFMTEKLGDAFLGWSYPIYFGGPEAYHHYPEGSFTAINIYKPDEALCILQAVLDADTYESRLEQIAAARHAVLHKNNFFAVLGEHWRANLEDHPPERVRLLPKCHRTGLVLRQFGRSVARPFSNRRVA